MGARKRVEASGGAAPSVIGNPLGPDRSTRAAGRLAWRDGPAARGPAGGGVVRRGRRALRPHPAALPRRPDRTDRRRRAPTCSTWGRAPASPPASCRRRAAACSASSPTRAWPRSGGATAFRPRWRRSRRGSRRAACSTRSSRGRRGTGSTRSRGRPRRRGCCGPAGCSSCSGTPSRCRPSWRTAFNAVYQRVLPGSPISLTARDAYPDVGRHRRRRHARRVRRARGVAVRLAARIHPRRVARAGADVRRPQPRSPPTSGPRWSRGSERRSTRSAAGS